MRSTWPDPREIARQILDYEGGDTDDSSQVAEAADRTLRKLRAHLEQLIGREGVRAVLARALAVAGREMRGLPTMKAASAGGSAIEGWQERVAALGPDQAREASVSILASFLNVLAGLLGWDLTRRILGQVWPGLTIAPG